MTAVVPAELDRLPGYDPGLRKRTTFAKRTLTRVLRDEVPNYTRLCTPSICGGQEFVDRPLQSDVSVSFSTPGSLVAQTGMFAETARLLASLHDADHAIVITNGSTGANQTAFAAVARLAPEGLFLIDRQCHHSVPSILTLAHLEWGYIGGCGWDAGWETPAPITASAVADAIEQADGQVACVAVTSPTYSGELADLQSIVATVRRRAPGAIVHVDQAWGSHLPWVPALASQTGMAAGADSAAISIHKQAGSLQPGAALLVRAARLPVDVVGAAYADLASTSQSLLVAASVDASQRYLAEHGEAELSAAAMRTADLKRRLRHRAPLLRFLDDERPGPHDPTKLTLRLDAYEISGHALDAALQKNGIVAEKASPGTITFLMTLAVDDDGTWHAADTISDLLEVAGQRQTPRRLLANPYAVGQLLPAVDPTWASRHAHSLGVTVSAEASIGLVAAERIEAYPPGTAVIFEGFRVTAEALAWLRAVVDEGGTVHARDKSLATVRVFPGTIA